MVRGRSRDESWLGDKVDNEEIMMRVGPMK